MIHGEMEPEAAAGVWSPARLRSFAAQGIEVERDGGDVRLGIPLAVAFDNPDLLHGVGLGRLLRGFGAEGQYRNDEQIDDSLRSILFQVPKPGTRDPSACGTPAVTPGCFSGTVISRVTSGQDSASAAIRCSTAAISASRKSTWRTAESTVSHSQTGRCTTDGPRPAVARAPRARTAGALRADARRARVVRVTARRGSRQPRARRRCLVVATPTRAASCLPLPLVHTRPRPFTNCFLCRALTPPEHLIVFGRGQGPAQAANPDSTDGRVWIRDP